MPETSCDNPIAPVFWNLKDGSLQKDLSTGIALSFKGLPKYNSCDFVLKIPYFGDCSNPMGFIVLIWERILGAVLTTI
jgi:hypothetical protein